MKLNFKRSDLLNSVNIVLKAVSSRTTMPILECILIDASEKGVYLTANDMELGIETGVENCQVLEGGRAAVDAKLFSEIIRKISLEDDSVITVTGDESSIITIVSDNSTFRIQYKDPDQFPSLPVIDKENYISLSQYTLKEVIRQTIFSISPNDSNKMMTGELFEVKGSELKVVSLDGHRISIKNTELKEDYGNMKVIIPGKTLNEISKIISGDNDKEVIIYFSKNHVLFKFDNTLMVSRLIDGEYFKIDQMLSSDYETKTVVNKKDFLDSIERSTILVRENDKKPLIINISDSTMSLKLNSILGSMDSELLVRKQGKDIMIGFNPRFLLDALRVIDDEEVSLYMTNPKAPCFIKDDNSKYIYLILPVNFNPSGY